MSYVYKQKIGNGMLEVTENDFKAIWAKASFIGDFPSKCGKCGSGDIAPMQKSPKGNDYYGLKCKECGAELTFHQRKEGGFYIRYDDVWTKFGESQGEAKSQEQAVRDVFQDDDPDGRIPF